MSFIVSAPAAVLFAGILGGTPFAGAVLFAALGLFFFSRIAGICLWRGGYALFVLLIILGAAGEAVAHVTSESGGMQAAWLVFLPALLLTFFSDGIRYVIRKIVCILYVCLLMLLHMYAVSEGTDAAHCFLSMQLAGAFAALSGTSFLQKRKNDA